MTYHEYHIINQLQDWRDTVVRAVTKLLELLELSGLFKSHEQSMKS